VAATLALLALPACGMGPDPASLVTRPRVVGARTSVTADPDRATPLPGDEVTIEPWLLQPDEASPVRATYLVCAAADIRRGASSCAGGPLALVPATPAGEALPPVTFTVPDAAALRGATQLLLVISSCDRGAIPTIEMGSLLPGCDDPEARAELSTLNVPLALDPSRANRNPSIVEETYTIEGREWAPPPETLPPLEGCAAMPDSDALPHVVVPSTAMPPTARDPYQVEVTFTTSEDDRESFGTGTTAGRESLQISHYTTAGRASRAFSAVEPSDPASVPEVLDWSPPAVDTIPEGGRLVRFTWVARDLRGGFARADRALCVLRGE
jgi:hypothetical protein